MNALQPLAYGSRHEVVIRDATGQPVPTCRLDHRLWWLAQQPGFHDLASHHRTRTIHY